jgi:signal transduction histidine kinase
VLPPLAADRNDTLLEAELLHELRHPLLGIKAGLELLARQLGAQLTGLDDYRLVVAQVGRLDEVIRSWHELLASPRASPIAVEAVVGRAVDLFGYRVRKLGPRFSYLPVAQHYGYGAAQALLHAVGNIVVNALDAAEEGDGRVLVRVLQAGPHVEVRVSDEGRGIAPDDRRRVFEARYTTKQNGSGLGLHIARTLMERAGGGVRLVDEQDPSRAAWARTEFSVFLPAVRP